MNLPRRTAIACLVALAAIALVPWFATRPASPLPQTYRNNTFGFYLPADYAVTEAPNTNAREENGTADIIEFGDRCGSVQLTITYASYAAPELTVQTFLSSFPLLSDTQTQPFPIAPGETGLALHYDPAHPNQTSDVWFAKDGLLTLELSSEGGRPANEWSDDARHYWNFLLLWVGNRGLRHEGL